MLPVITYVTNCNITDRGPLEMTQIGDTTSHSTTYLLMNHINGLDLKVIYF